MIISTMKRGELKECAHLAAEAFNDYCYFTNYFPDDRERTAVLHSMIEHEYRTNFGKAIYLVAKEAERIIATAQLNSPAYRKPSDLSYALHGWIHVYKAGDRERIDRWLAMDKAAGTPCHEYAAANKDTWYLSSLTVSPAAQGTGAGSAILKWVEEYVKSKDGKAVTFFTNSQKNIDYYKKRGYEEFDYREFTNNGITMGNWSVRKMF